MDKVTIKRGERCVARYVTRLARVYSPRIDHRSSVTKLKFTVHWIGSAAPVITFNDAGVTGDGPVTVSLVP